MKISRILEEIDDWLNGASASNTSLLEYVQPAELYLNKYQSRILAIVSSHSLDIDQTVTSLKFLDLSFITIV